MQKNVTSHTVFKAELDADITS